MASVLSVFAFILLVLVVFYRRLSAHSRAVVIALGWLLLGLSRPIFLQPLSL